MANKLTIAEREAMERLSFFAINCMRSKIKLRILSRLHNKGLIEFDALAGEAALTDDGRKALADD